MDIITIDEDNTYKLITEKIGSSWWIELIHKASGNSQIIQSTNKKQALSFFEGSTLPQIKDFLNHWGVDAVKMYKKNVI